MRTASRAFIYGQPIGHSISPLIHNAAFKEAGIPVRYEAREVSATELAQAIERLRQPDVLGANITVPHKEAVIRLVDEVDPAAALIGSVNTITNRGACLVASNTDAPGFARALKEALIRVEQADVLVLGAGGSARAVVYAVLSAGARCVLIANRTLERAAQLASGLHEHFPNSILLTGALADLGPAEVGARTLIVNTTVVGLDSDETPLDARLLPRVGALVDIIYRPAQTRLMRDAAASGLRTLNGLGMLVHQAALAWETWVGRPAPLEAMWQAARLAQAEATPTRSRQ